jgi:hypothetical protein
MQETVSQALNFDACRYMRLSIDAIGTPDDQTPFSRDVDGIIKGLNGAAPATSAACTVI